jgi:pimeloyl-ACP methyl ester carboxylesterase
MKRLAILGLALVLLSCGSTASPPAAPAEPHVAVEAGFLDVPARDVSLKGQSIRIEATARLFYNLRPADESPADKPIFVLFNGFAAEVVRAYGTGPTTVSDGGAVVANASSLTRVANLLYIDPRQAGFSYDVLANRAPAASDCASAIFNEYVDAADVLFAVLAFLDAHPELRGPVYWVGESYAGVRVQWILAYLRGRWDLASYEDGALASKIAQTSRATSLRAGQILLEPWLVGRAHADAIAAVCSDPDEIAGVSASVGSACAPSSACDCANADDRSLYNYTYTVEHQTAREREACEAHVIPERAAALFGLPLTSIPQLAASSHALGFKCSAPDATVPQEDALVALLGALPAGQFYYAPYSPLLPGKETAPTTLDWRTQNFVGDAFVDDLRDVPTFVTNGDRDLVVPTRALAPALRTLVGADRVDAISPSQLVVKYPDGARTIEIRTYPSAGHMVTMLEADAFARDVIAWLPQR